MDKSSTGVSVRNCFLLGFGGVGRALARQILAARSLHRRRNGLRLNIIGVADSAGAYVETGGITDARLEQLLDAKTRTGRAHLM